MRYGATHRGFESRPLRQLLAWKSPVPGRTRIPGSSRRPRPNPPISFLAVTAGADSGPNRAAGTSSRRGEPAFRALPGTSRRDPRRGGRGPSALDFSGRARRGTSGALYLQSAPAGLNSLPRSPLSSAADWGDVEGRVPRSGDPRTVSGPEGSSTKRPSPGAAVRPGPSRSLWWARERSGRRRVHGKLSPATTSREHRNLNASHQALYRRWRAQTFDQIVGQEPVVDDAPQRRASDQVARPPLRRPARDRQDVDGADRRQGPQLHGPRGRSSRAITARPASRSARAAPSTSSRWTPRRTTGSTTSGSSCRGSLPRRSDLRRKVFIVDEVQRIKEGWDLLLKTLEEPPDHVAFIFCTTDSSGIRPGRPLAGPALRLPAPECRPDRGQASNGSSKPTGGPPIPRRSAWWLGSRRAACATPSRCSTSCSRPAPSGSMRVRFATCSASPTTRPSSASSTRSPGATRSTASALLDDLEDRGRDVRVFLDQVVDALRLALVARLTSAGGVGDAGIAGLAAAAGRLGSHRPVAHRPRVAFDSSSSLPSWQPGRPPQQWRRRGPAAIAGSRTSPRADSRPPPKPTAPRSTQAPEPELHRKATPGRRARTRFTRPPRRRPPNPAPAGAGGPAPQRPGSRSCSVAGRRSSPTSASTRRPSRSSPRAARSRSRATS